MQDTLRKVVKDMIDSTPEEKLKEVFEVLENMVVREDMEGWRIWEELGKDAAEGKWKDASEKHDFYLYGISK